MPVDVLLVDDHKIMRDGIKAILERDAGFRVVTFDQVSGRSWPASGSIGIRAVSS